MFSETKIHTYKEVYISHVVIKANGTCEKYPGYMYHRREVINKMACYHPYECQKLPTELYWWTDTRADNNVCPPARLFVSSKCATGRDTFRNSGYEIKLDPGKADAVIVPDVMPERYHNMECNLVAKDEENDELYLISIEKSGYSSNSLDMNDIDMVRTFLTNAYHLTVDDTRLIKLNVWFIPKCDELKDIMQNTALNIPYIQESKLAVKASTNICPETLVFWENIDNKNLLVRTICTSDWQQYPITLLIFLDTIVDSRRYNWYNYANNDFRRILQQIGYRDYCTIENTLDGKWISEKDYAMLQSYIYYKMGVDENNGGFVNPSVWDKLPDVMKRLVQRKVAVKPFTPPTGMRIAELLNVLQ